MRFDFTYTLDDLRAALAIARKQKVGRHQQRWLQGTRIAIVLFVACAACYVATRPPAPAVINPPASPSLMDYVRPFEPYLIVIPVVAGLVFFVKRNAMKGNSLLRDPIALTLTPDGIDVVIGATQTFRRWEAFNTVVETEARFLLGIANARACLALPKRVMAPADIPAVRELLVANVRPQTAAFP